MPLHMSARRPDRHRSAPPSRTAPAEATQPGPLSRFLPPWRCALLALAVFAAYLPGLGGGFLWDDAGHVTRADLRSLDGLLRIWFEPGATQQYYPLLHSAFWLEHRLWGDAPLGYHLANLAQHIAAACLFGALLARLRVPGAWLGAALFALHPVCVESVAWISEQKNTLSLLIGLLAAHAWLHYEERRTPGRMLAAAALFAAALAGKTVTATLPAALLVIAWWRRGNLGWRRDVLPLLPWFALAAAAGLVTAWVERTQIGAHGEDFALGAADRLVLAGRIVWFYLGKLLWPYELTFIYPRWTVDASEAWQWLFAIALVAMASLFLWLAVRRGRRGPLAALLLYGGMLFPALGFIDVYPFVFSWVADHFQYHASLAFFAALAAGLTQQAARLPAMAAPILSGTLLAMLGALTWSQAGMYRNLFTLYETTLARNPGCWMAHNNLGSTLVEAGRAEEALAHFQRAIALRPRYAEAENNLGEALTRLGKPAEALAPLERAIALQPRYAEARNNLGVALLSLGRADEGVAQIAEALRLRPVYPMAHFNLGIAHARAGRMPKALEHFETAVRQQPDFAAAREALEQARAELANRR